MMIEVDVNAVTDFLSQHEVNEPIVIKRQGTQHAVMVLYEIFQVLRVDELTYEDTEAILNSKPPTGHDCYNNDYDD